MPSVAKSEPLVPFQQIAYARERLAGVAPPVPSERRLSKERIAATQSPPDSMSKESQRAIPMQQEPRLYRGLSPISKGFDALLLVFWLVDFWLVDFLRGLKAELLLATQSRLG
jgi:hypothetical protein